MYFSQELMIAAMFLHRRNYVDRPREQMEGYFRHLSSVQPGDVISFGRHRISEGMKPQERTALRRGITWNVLERTGDRLLLISEYIIDWEMFGDYHDTWETSFLREELNGDCLNDWFTWEEQSLLVREPDAVFLLGANGVRKFFSRPGSARAVMLQTDDFLADDGTDLPIIGEEYHEWWLRSPGTDDGCIMYVDCSGNIDQEGYDPGADEFGVRPVIRIDLSRIPLIYKDK